MSCSNFHRVSGLAAGEANVTMTITNGTNISSLDSFELLLCVNPNTVVTGDPLPYLITVNGTAVPLYNKYSLPIYTDRLKMRKRYYGAYVAPEGDDPYVILWNTPGCPFYATGGVPSASTATTTSTTTEGGDVTPSVTPSTRSSTKSSS